jgi:hypothetical protein
MGKAAALCGDILRGLRERPQQPMAKKRAGDIPLKLTEAEQDLLWHMEHGYQLETDSLSGNPVLRLKNGETVRPATANRNTVKSLEERGLIVPGKGRDPLKIVWRMKGKGRKIKARMRS